MLTRVTLSAWHYGRRLLFIAGLLAGTSILSAQSVVLSSGSAPIGSSILLNLSLNTPSGTAQPAGIQWTFSYPTAEVSIFSVAAGPVLATANKSLTCAGSAQSYTCLATGMTTDTIPNGVVATVSVVLASGATTAAIGVGNPVSASLAGEALPLSATGGSASLTNSPPTLAALSCTANILGVNASSSCTVTLSNAAPAGGSVVTLSNSLALLLTSPTSVTVPANASSATFNVSTGALLASQIATLTASLNGSSASTTVSLQTPGSVSSLQCTPNALSSNGAASCAVTLSNAAPAGGSVVTLSNSAAPTLTAPASVTVPANASSATFGISTGVLSTTRTAILIASLIDSSASTTVSLIADGLVSSLQCTPGTLSSNGAASCTITLSHTAPFGGSIVTLSNSAAPTLTAPASVAVATNASSATFNISTGSLSTSQTATLTASLSGSSASTTISLQAAALVSSVQCSPNALSSNSTASCTVTLSNAAPSGGSVVTLSNSAAPTLTAPASVTVAANASSATFGVSTGSLSTNETATLIASLSGSSASTTVSLQAAAILVSSLQCSPNALSSNGTGLCTVTLSHTAPSGGSVVTLSNSAAPTLTAPASVTVAANASSATFGISIGTVSANQTATVTASLSGSSASAAVSLQTQIFVSSLQCVPNTLSSNATATCTVTLSQAAPSGGAVVTLSDTAPSVLIAPASVTVPANAFSASFGISTGTLSANQTATLTASLNTSGTITTGSSTGNQTGAPNSVSTIVSLQAAGVVSSLQCTPNTLSSNTTASCSVTLSQAAPSGGAVVTLLNSAAAALTAPASVTVPANTSSATFSIWTGALSANQTVTLTASTNNVSAAATISLTAPATISAIACSASALVPQSSASCTVSLTNPVPAGSSVSIAVSSSSGSLTVPNSALTISSGLSSVTFTAQAGAFSAGGAATVTASLNGVSQSFSISLSLLSLSSLICTPASVAAGGSGSCSVTVNTSSPSSLTVVLTVSNTGLSLPPAVTISSGATAATFTYTASTTVTGWVVLKAAFGGVSKSLVIAVVAPVSSAPQAKPSGTTPASAPITPAALSCDQPFLAGGHRMGCELQLNAASVSESMEVSITSDTSSLTAPAMVGARTGQSRIRFEIGADRAATQGTAVLEARIGSESVQSSITIEPADTPDLVVPTDPAGTPQSPIRFTATASDARGLGVTLAASGLPAGANFDRASGVLQWEPTDKDLGVHEIAFTATNTLGAATTRTVKLYVDSGLPVVTKLENGAGSSAPAGCSPGSVATLRGRSLFAGTIPASDRSGASAELGGTRVLVNGSYAAVLYASANRVDLLCPAAAAGTRLAITVETAAGQSKELDNVMRTSVPGLFTADDSGAGQAMAVRSGTLDLAAIPNARFSGKAALPGDSLSFLATGIDCSPETAVNLSVHLGSDVLPVTGVKLLAGHAGLCEIQVAVPFGGTGDAVPATLQFLQGDGQKITSNNTTRCV